MNEAMIERAAVSYAGMRMALGVGAGVAPGVLSRAFGLGSGPGARVAARHLGVRDFVFGLGLMLGRRHDTARGWYEGIAAVDLADAVIAFGAGASGLMPKKRANLIALLALGSAATGLALARLDPHAAGDNQTPTDPRQGPPEQTQSRAGGSPS